MMTKWKFLLADGPNEWFDGYSYSGDDRALLKPIRQKLCLWLVSFLPMHWASHGLTIIGSLCVLPAMFAMMWCAPNGRDTVEYDWVSVLCAIGAILWDLLDNMDGPQARRTKTAGILGDFLDHMLDYISLAIVVYGFLWSTGLGTDGVGLVLCAVALVAHECMCYMTWWGRRYTKHVVLGAISQDEAVVILAGLMFYSATISPDYWQEHITTVGDVVLSRSKCVALFTLFSLGGGGLFLCGMETLTHASFPREKRKEALMALWPMLCFLLSLGFAIKVLVQNGENVPHPSMAVVFMAVSSVCWPLSNLQLLAALACRSPGTIVNLTLCLCPIGMAFVHICAPSFGLLVASLSIHLVTIVASKHIAGLLMKKVGSQSLWIIPTKHE